MITVEVSKRENKKQYRKSMKPKAGSLKWSTKLMNFSYTVQGNKGDLNEW